MTNQTTTITTPTTATLRPLLGRTAVVTGASSGIGEATARQLAAAGASVALVGRRGDRLEALSAAIAERDDQAGRTLSVAADLTEPGAIAGLADQIRRELGPVDLVVANAGAMLAAPFEDADPAEWDRMLDLNVRALLATGQAFAADLLAAAEAGRPADLVHVGSIAGHLVFPHYAVYGATKAAVNQLTRNLRAELGPRGVRVRNVEPGFTKTELGSDMALEQSMGDLEAMRDALGRDNMLAADDIAAAITYSVSAPAHVNLAELVVVPTKQG